MIEKYEYKSLWRIAAFHWQVNHNEKYYRDVDEALNELCPDGWEPWKRFGTTLIFRRPT